MDSLLLLKPDVHKRRLTQTILDRVKAAGLEIGPNYSVVPPADLVLAHYENSIKKHSQAVGQKLVTYFQSGPVLATIVRGDDAIVRLRELSGLEACPSQCLPGSIRRDYGLDTLAQAKAEGRGVNNLVHSSDSLAEARREIGLWFYKFLPAHLDERVYGYPLLR